MDELLEGDLTYRIRGCVFEVYRQMGAGFLEQVYEKALCLELQNHGLHATSQAPLIVNYKGVCVGEYRVDILVEESVILEIKAQAQLRPEHEAQLLNYLKASGKPVGLLVNFSYPKADVKRLVL